MSGLTKRELEEAVKSGVLGAFNTIVFGLIIGVVVIGVLLWLANR